MNNKDFVEVDIVILTIYLVCSVYAMEEYTILSRNINKQCGSVLGLQACWLG